MPVHRTRADALSTRTRAVSLDLRPLSPDTAYSRLLALHRDLLAGGVEEGLPRVRIAVAGCATTSLLLPMLRAFLWPHRLAADLYEAPFGTPLQAALDRGGDLHAFRPEIVLLLPHASMVRLPAPEDAEAALSAEVAPWREAWRACADAGAQVVQGNFVVPAPSALGHHAARVRSSPLRYLQDLNRALADALPPGALLHDTDHLASVEGRLRWSDPVWWHLARQDVSPACLPRLAHSLAGLVAALRGRSRRCLVLDLDDTLWGGVVGEVGPEGLDLGAGSPVGEAYVDFQRYLRDLRDRGVLLAVCSKNDPETARRPFRERPEMVLREEDFAAFAAGWGDKAAGLRGLAEELRLGLDALAFADDHPGERELVRHLLPEVAVIDLPEDPSRYVEAVDAARLFEPAGLTDEDRHRAESYRAERSRRELERSAGSVEGFLHRLEMVLRVEPVGPERLPRVAQLVAKTNQFNLTGRRRTEPALGEIARRPGWIALAGSLRDALGDHGLITVLLAEARGPDLVVDTWVMSCRVLQRGVETALFARLVERARALGLRRVVGLYVASERNGLVRELYRSLGFEGPESSPEGERWILPVEREAVTPGWMSVEDPG